MKPIKLLLWLLALCFSLTNAAYASEKYPAAVGKDGWLFYENEYNPLIEQRGVDTSIKLIGEFSQMLQSKGIRLVVTLVPVKARLYSEHLPDSVKWSKDQDSRYAQWAEKFKSAGVNFVDLNSAFMNSPLRNSETPLYYRLDTHWSPTGVELAAKTVTAALQGQAETAKLINESQAMAFKRTQGNKLRVFRARDMLSILPPEEAQKEFPFEKFYPVTHQRPPSDAQLTGASAAPSIALVGSSYSMTWTGFADDLRAFLQRDLVNVSIPANQGQWYGIESYLKDEAFQASPPKILIWEMPERDLYATPNFEFREARYRSTDSDWLRKVSASIAKAKSLK